MILGKAAYYKMLCFLTAITALGMLSGGCAFANRYVTLDTLYTDNLPFSKVKSSPVYVACPKDARGHKSPNFVGYVRGDFSIHTADVLGYITVNEWVKNCLTANLKRAGFKVYEEKSAEKGLCVYTTINYLECDISYTLDATVSITVKLKKNDQEFFAQSFTGRASRLNLALSPMEYQVALTKAMQECLDEMFPYLISELEKNNDIKVLKKE